ncbi:MAG: BACON domain-containing protein, partial [Bacteroidales bacterium]|nr:BACON domain-containing protein [Bacteroidales bacterium]
MKFRNLFVAAVAAFFALWSCEEEKPTLGITVEPDQVEIARMGGGTSIEIKTDQAWTITVPREADWLLVDPLSGGGSQYVNLYAEANNGKLRSATIIVKAGYDMVPV